MEQLDIKQCGFRCGVKCGIRWGFGLLLLSAAGVAALKLAPAGLAAPISEQDVNDSVFEGPGGSKSSLTQLSIIPLSMGQISDAYLAQQVTNELPPPPPYVQFGDDPNLAPAGSRSNPGSDLGAVAETRYLVYIHGNSDLLLEQVRKVEPGAFRRTYEGRPVIQAGLFGDTFGANNRVRELQDEGIGAQIEALTANASSSVSTPTPVSVASSPSVDSASLPVTVVPQSIESTATVESSPSVAAVIPNASPYWVAIPASKSNLDDVVAQVALAGVEPTGIQRAKDSRGRYVKVGPFVDRQAAQRWSRYLRELGMDARIDYQP